MSGALTPVPTRSTLREQVVDRLRKSIFSGVLPPGSQLVETQIAAQLGVSRGPLREATRQLVEEGLLVTKPYTGTFVIEMTARDVEEIYSMRTVLETFAFRLLWDKRDEKFFREIDARHEALLGVLGTADSETVIEAELHLHSTPYEFSGNRLLLDTWRSMSARLHFYFAVHQRAHGRRGPRSDAHVRYVELAKGARFEDMAEEIEDHMRRGLDTVIEFLSKSCEWARIRETGQP